MSTYYLSRDVFFCRAVRNWIFLDVRNDTYFSIPSVEAESLARVIEKPKQPDRMEPAASQLDTTHLLHELLRRGVLCTDARKARALEATVIAKATSTLRADDRAGRHAPLTELTGVLAHATLASLQLRFVPFHAIVGMITGHVPPEPERSRRFDPAVANRVVELFNTARPFFPRKYLCLHECLAMLRLCHAYGLYPRWVFGVTEDPFSAHCWLQQGSTVINDNLDRVNAYTPIMAV